jgi:PAS domain S-box-containing protein
VCSTEPREFDEEDVLFVETIAHLASAAISRIRAEESLAEQQRLARGVLQTVEALVLFLNGKGQVVSANPACQRLTGFSLEEIRGRYVWDVFCIPEEAETFRQHMVQLREEKVTVEYESCLLTKHAEQCHITWSCNAIENGDGALDSIIATGIDVTEQYRARAEAERAVQTAEQARQVMARALLAAERGNAPSRTDWSVPKQPADKVPAMTNSADLPSHVAYERRRQPRRAFPYKQRIAPILDEKLPDRKVFEEVQCRDVAASGFSFLHPTPPVSDTLVVALGVPPNMSYLVAQVVHVTRFDDRGQERYLVGCKYIGRASY